MTGSLRIVCLTVDVEPDCPPYLQGWRGLHEGMPRVLDVLAREAVPATCFSTGRAALQAPDLMRRIVATGHELACHGMTHRRFSTLEVSEARRELRDATEVLRAFAPITSFRAPNLDLPPAHLPLLVEAGFTLDSSAATYKPGSRRAVGHPGLTRIPASVTSSVLRLPSFIRDPWLLALESPVVLFVHPWEFVDLTREKLRLDCRFRTGAPALRAMREVIHLFQARSARFVRMRDLLPGPGAFPAALA